QRQLPGGINEQAALRQNGVPRSLPRRHGLAAWLGRRRLASDLLALTMAWNDTNLKTQALASQRVEQPRRAVPVTQVTRLPRCRMYCPCRTSPRDGHFLSTSTSAPAQAPGLFFAQQASGNSPGAADFRRVGAGLAHQPR